MMMTTTTMTVIADTCNSLHRLANEIEFTTRTEPMKWVNGP